MSAFYRDRGGGRFESTEHTRGPWSPEHQHAGPPAALLGRAIERTEGLTGAHLGRVTFEVLGPIPIVPVEVEARVARPGRRVDMVEAQLSAEGKPLMLARAWRVRREEVGVPVEARDAGAALNGPRTGRPRASFPGTPEVGWHAAMEICFLYGAFGEVGPAAAWFRIRGELVEGESPSPLAHLLAAADAGNGISGVLDFRRHLFINTDLTVHLFRVPEGEWMGLDSVTRLSGDGAGMSDSVLHDERGPIGRALQTLLVDER